MYCATCGAALTSVDVRCVYCQSVTPLGEHELALPKRHGDDEASRRRERARERMAIRAEKAARWTFTGIFALGLTNFYHGLKAVRIARANGLAVPVKSKVALVAGVVHFAVGVGLISLGVARNAAHRARVQAVVAALALRDADEHLAHDVACLLFERQQQQSLLGMVTTAVCDGSLVTRGADAVLEGVHLERWWMRQAVDVCLRRGTSWYVAAVGARVECGGSRPGAGVVAPLGEGARSEPHDEPSAAPARR